MTEITYTTTVQIQKTVIAEPLPAPVVKKPKPKTVQVALYLPADWLKEAKMESMNSGIRVNQVLLNWIKKAKNN